jgi:transposase
MKKLMKESMNAFSALEAEAVVEGARWASEDSVASAPPPDPEVAATAKRRQFSSSEKRRILTAAERCTATGQIGALLRREGIYSSHLTTWRKQRAATELAALEPQKRGRKADPALAEARRAEVLVRENARLRHQLAQAHTIIDVQKKLCTLLGLPTAETPDGTF